VRDSNLGFTLVEVLVVVAIIVVLAGILFPVFFGAEEKSRQVACLSNLRQLGHAFAMYRNDYDGYMPYMVLAGRDPVTKTLTYYRWINAIYPYVKNAEVFACPSCPVYTDPASRPTVLAPLPETSYFYCSYYMTDVHVSSIKDVSGTIVLMDGWYFRGGGGVGGANYPMFWANLADATYMADWINWRVTPYYVDGMVLERLHRHNGGVNVSYYDGHCKLVKSARPQDFTPATD